MPCCKGNVIKLSVSLNQCCHWLIAVRLRIIVKEQAEGLKYTSPRQRLG